MPPRDDAEAAAAAIDEAQQQLNVLYESIPDTPPDGCCMGGAYPLVDGAAWGVWFQDIRIACRKTSE
jgi:hypothetical protein